MNKSLSRENVLIIKNLYQLDNNRKIFRDEISNLAGVESVAICNEVPGITGYSYYGKPVDTAAFNAIIAVYRCDENYLDALGMQLVEGRFFQPELFSENRSIILNETAVQVLGWENPIGKKYSLFETYTVTGVVKNIHFDSFHNEILPQGLILLPENTGNKMLVKIVPGKIQENLKAISQLWLKYVPDKAMHFSFLDQELDSWYQSERKTGQLAVLLALMAVFLSELGLFAMVLQGVSGRMKEIGIRKVNGARVFEVLKLLNKDFVRWVVIAFVIITPLSWYVMHSWLKIFAYKTNLSWWLFVLAGLVTLLFSLIASSWQSWRAATRNPVEALRYE